MDTILNFEGNRVEINEFEHNKKREEAGFVMRVESKAGFAGTARFICDIDEFRRFILDLDKLYNRQLISVKLVDQSLGSYILFKMSSREIYTVKGILVGSDGEHILKYELSIKRPEIFEFIKQIRDMITEYYEKAASH